MQQKGHQHNTHCYGANVNLNLKVLDLVELGGSEWTMDGTIFEMWLCIL